MLRHDRNGGIDGMHGIVRHDINQQPLDVAVDLPHTSAVADRVDVDVAHEQTLFSCETLPLLAIDTTGAEV